MKRLWIGIGLLASILLIGLLTTARLGNIHTDIGENLRTSAHAAQAGNWDKADELAQIAEEDWRSNRNFTAALADHTVLDEIDAFFAQATAYRENRAAMEYAAICGRLSVAVEAIQDGHRLTWWNLL